jgi:hypothetical protein
LKQVVDYEDKSTRFITDTFGGYKTMGEVMTHHVVTNKQEVVDGVKIHTSRLGAFGIGLNGRGMVFTTIILGGALRSTSQRLRSSIIIRKTPTCLEVSRAGVFLCWFKNHYSIL